MRAVPIAFAVLALSTVAGHAEDMTLTNQQGIMCRDEKSLADFTAPDGTMKNTVMANPASAVANRFRTACRDAGDTVHVVTKRKNTSIVTFEGATWYVPNIDYMTPGADCIKEGSRVSFTGTVEPAFHRTDEDDPKKGLHYARLTLDKPVCYIGNLSEKDGRHVALLGGSMDAAKKLLAMAGKHITVTGEVGSPDNGNQPSDAMMIFDPVVKPAG
jgi:hypothetical protein